MAVLTQVSQLEDRRLPTTTLEGWRRFADAELIMAADHELGFGIGERLICVGVLQLRFAG